MIEFVNRVTARHLHRTVLLATVLMPGACYHYVPATEVSSGAQVRARLTVEGTDSLVRRFGPGVAEVTGTMLSRDEEGVSVLVSEYYSERSGSRAIWNEAVRLPSAGVAAVEERRLHVARSALFGAAVLGGVGLLAVALDINDRTLDVDDEVEPGPTESRIPAGIRAVLIRIPLGQR